MSFDYALIFFATFRQLFSSRSHCRFFTRGQYVNINIHTARLLILPLIRFTLISMTFSFFMPMRMYAQPRLLRTAMAIWRPRHADDSAAPIRFSSHVIRRLQLGIFAPPMRSMRRT